MKNLFLFLYYIIFFLACDTLKLKVDPVKENPITITSANTLSTLKGACIVNYLIFLDANNSNNVIINQGLNDAFNELNNLGLSLKFIRATSNSNLQIRFLNKEIFDFTNSKGVYKVVNYNLSKIEGNTIFLNRNFSWNTNSIKQVLMHNIGLMLGLPKSNEISSFMYPSLINVPFQVTQADKTLLQSYSPPSVSSVGVAISQSLVGAKFITLSMNISNNNNVKFSKTGFCISNTNSLPTINDLKVEETRPDSYYRSFSDLNPNQTYYVRGFISNECEIRYTNTLTIRTKQTDSWESVNFFPSEFQPRFESTVIASSESYQSKAYVIGGQFVSNGTFTNEVWEFYPAANAWKRKTPFPGRTRFGATGVYFNNKIYYGLGYNNGLLSDWWEYDILKDTWTQKSNQPEGGRVSGSTFVNGNSILLAGGSRFNGSSYSTINTSYMYVPSTDSWSNLSSPTPAVLGVQISFFPNSIPHLLVPNPNNLLYQYSSNNRWILMANFPFNSRNDAQYASTGDKIFCGLGTSGNVSFFDWYSYNPITNSWSGKKNPSIAIRNYTKMTFSLGNDKIYFLGGFNSSNNYVSQILEYNPD